MQLFNKIIQRCNLRKCLHLRFTDFRKKQKGIFENSNSAKNFHPLGSGNFIDIVVRQTTYQNFLKL